MAEIDIENPGADAAALSAAIRALSFEGLPTIDPNNVGSLWIDGGVVCVSNGDPADWVPAGALMHVDTINNRYYARGAKRVRSDVLSLAGGVTLSEEGLVYSHVDLGVALTGNLVGAALADLIATDPNFTMLITAKIPSNTTSRSSLIAVGTNNFNVHFARDGAATAISIFDAVGSGDLEFTDANLDVVSKLAVSVDSGGSYSASANGATVQIGTFGDPVSFKDGSVELRVGSLLAPHIRTITVWPLKDNAELPALST